MQWCHQIGRRGCCSCTGAEEKSQYLRENRKMCGGKKTDGDVSQEGGGKRRGDISRGGGQQEEGRQADFLYDLCYGQPLREIGTLAARRRGTFLRLRVRCVAASAVNVDCSPRPSVPAARSARLCPAPLPQIAPKERH